MQRWLIGLTVLAAAGIAGCELDLGQAPFLCHGGAPRCPSGYSCVAHQGQEWCLKNGSSLLPKDASSGKVDLPVTKQDQGAKPIDQGAKPMDQAVKPMDQWPWPDAMPWPDTKPWPKDKGTTHTCAHSPCVTGGPLATGCHPCVTSVCNFDLFCCFPLVGAWDATCVSSFKKSCKCP